MKSQEMKQKCEHVQKAQAASFSDLPPPPEFRNWLCMEIFHSAAPGRTQGRDDRWSLPKRKVLKSYLIQNMSSKDSLIIDQ